MNPSDDTRLDALKQWLAALPPEHALDLTTLAPASSDASFRRYFRLESTYGSAIVMDAPPPTEDCRPFVRVTDILAQAGINVPEVYALDLDRGFMLLSDLGRQTYYQAVTAGLDDVKLQALYRQAISTLVQMQHADYTALPRYDLALLRNELELFPVWFIDRHCGVQLSDVDQAMLQNTFDLLASDAAAQPVALVHRDYHSPNLVICDQPDATTPGIIDYQDALAGPITYDIASLVMDARTTWEEPQQLDWAIRYWQSARDANLPVHADFAEFHRAYEWTSLQRNLRILGVFSRLSYRDEKSHYMDHIPRVIAYIRQVAGRYGPFVPLLRLLDRLENRQISYGYTF